MPDGWGLLDIIHEEGFNKKISYYGYFFCRSEDKDSIVFKNNSFCRKTV
jgi:hypothetical protein